MGKRNDRAKKPDGNTHPRYNSNKLPREDGDARRSGGKMLSDWGCYKGANDWQWYAQTPALVKAYASYPFGYALGYDVDLGSDAYVGSVPGVMGFGYVPSVGVAQTEVSPINVAMRNLYTFVRHENSGHTNYEAPDLMLYVLAMTQVYAFHAFLRRVYGITKLYAHENRYYPKAILDVMGVNLDSLITSLADFNGYINWFATRAQRFAVPASMSYVTRQIWMNTHLFMDGNTPKAQTYFYYPLGFWQFQEDYANNAGGLAFLPLHTYTQGVQSALTLSELQAIGEKLLQPILASEAMNIMSGDILKAYTKQHLFSLEATPMDYTVTPTYNVEVLSQFENCVIFQNPLTAGNNLSGTFLNVILRSWGVAQNTNLDTGYLQSVPSVLLGQQPRYTVAEPNVNSAYLQWQAANLTAVCAPYSANKLINFHHSDVKPEETMVATRCTAVASSSLFVQDSSAPAITVSAPLWACGSEFIISAQYAFYRNGAVQKREIATVTTAESAVYAFTNAGDNLQLAYSAKEPRLVVDGGDMLRNLNNISRFDWHPGVYVALLPNIDGPTGSLSITGATNFKQVNPAVSGPLPAMDIDYYATVTPDNLANLHRVALLSEFTIPGINYFDA